VKTSTADLQAQFAISKSMYDDMLRATTALREIAALREQMKAGTAHLPASSSEGLEAKLNLLAGARGGEGGGGRRGGAAGAPNLASVRTQLARLEHSIQNADVAPTTAQVEAYQIAAKPLADLLQQWDALKKNDVAALNSELRRKHLPILDLDPRHMDGDMEDEIGMEDEE
jgi:hypothetical protein